MKKEKKHSYKEWEVSICEFFDNENRIYKVTRRLYKLSVSETKTFNSKEEAIKQFNEWLE